MPQRSTPRRSLRRLALPLALLAGSSALGGCAYYDPYGYYGGYYGGAYPAYAYPAPVVGSTTLAFSFGSGWGGGWHRPCCWGGWGGGWGWHHWR